ncbi:RNA 3'-terminal phosphate cyclase [Pseudomonas aeruginosa]|nr:RNA 3'-terminal phosphate cyclase [Pseudomonas aeruginosa]
MTSVSRCRNHSIMAGAASGLLRQHLTAVRAAAEICAAEVEGAGSAHTTGVPARCDPRRRDYAFAIGSAGSCSLVLQAFCRRCSRPTAKAG